MEGFFENEDDLSVSLEELLQHWDAPPLLQTGVGEMEAMLNNDQLPHLAADGGQPEVLALSRPAASVEVGAATNSASSSAAPEIGAVDRSLSKNS